MAFQISLFKVGLVVMLLLIIASLVLNIVAIATNFWTDSGDTSLWQPCNINGLRDRCFYINPPALIATGTAFNCLAFILILVAQLALFLVKFRDSIALYFVIGAEVASILSLIFNTIGWYFVLQPQYQSVCDVLDVFFIKLILFFLGDNNKNDVSYKGFQSKLTHKNIWFLQFIFFKQLMS